MQSHQKLVLLKDGNKHEMYYENDDIEFGADLNEDEYKKLFENFQSNTSFSTPDKMIQDNITNGNTYPTFKTSMSFNSDDMKGIIDTFRKEMSYVIEEKMKRKRAKNILRNKTRRKPQTQSKRSKILNNKSNNKLKKNKLNNNKSINNKTNKNNPKNNKSKKKQNNKEN